jgi:hypothetical protein
MTSPPRVQPAIAHNGSFETKSTERSPDMAKTITLIRTEHPDHFCKWYEQVYAPELTTKYPGLRRLALNVTDPDFTHSHASLAMPETYDFGVEAWFDGEVPADFHKDSEIRERASAVYTYRVEEIFEKGPFRPRDNKPSPGIKSFVPLIPRKDITAGETRQHYTEHGPLALEVHIGMAGYTRHWTEAPLDKDAPDYFGFSLLHFPTDEDYRERYFVTPDRKQDIIDDVYEFLSGVALMMTREHVLVDR